MAPKLDPAITKALCLDAPSTTIASHGGSGFASTFKITSTVDGKEKLFFIKTGKGKDSEIMFAGIPFPSLGCTHVIETELNRRTCLPERNPLCSPRPLPQILCQWPSLGWKRLLPGNRFPQSLSRINEPRIRPHPRSKTCQTPQRTSSRARWILHTNVWFPCPYMLWGYPAR